MADVITALVIVILIGPVLMLTLQGMTYAAEWIIDHIRR